MKKYLCLAAVILILCSCAAVPDKEYSKTVYAMDTVMEIKAYGDNASKALELAEKKILDLDKRLSRGSAGSEIYLLNEKKEYEVSYDTAELIKRAIEISKETDGAFDISSAPLTDIWGFYTKQYRLPSEGEIDEALKKVGYENVSVTGNKVSLKNGAEVDLGGIAKGYLSSEIAKIYKECGVENGIISLGGNVQAIGKKDGKDNWRVAVQSPDGEGYLGIVSVSDAAVITSGGYQRFFEKDGKTYHHIFDTKSGCPSESGLKSVTVVSKDGTLADGLSTAIFVMGTEKGIELWRSDPGFELILEDDSSELYITEGLEGVFESDREYKVIKRNGN